MANISGQYPSLTGITPHVSNHELLSSLVPPREFVEARFENYVPDLAHPSQANAVTRAQMFAQGRSEKVGLFAKRVPSAQGLYLDGGFGVGKTHLLASIWHQFKGKKAFGSFLAYTGLIGVLGFAGAVKQFSHFELLCIDEFELDDPGDTMMMSRLLSELSLKGVRFAATSNTPPNALGQGRFAAADFAREINAMSDRFEILTIDGEDYRHRPIDQVPTEVSDAELDAWLARAAQQGIAVCEDDFELLLAHLATIHPSKYLQLLANYSALGLRNVVQLTDQVKALRFVALVDRLYESQYQLCNTGHSLTDVFSSEMLQGGYRKKYLRAVSRLGSMTKG